MDFLQNDLVLVAITLAVYWLMSRLQNRTGLILLNPLLLTIIILISLLRWTGIPYEVYRPAGAHIEFWLKPAIVALGYPLYLHLHTVRKQFFPILFSQFVGCVVGIVSAVLIARVMGASDEVVTSMATKSVTAPIAIEISQSIGGIPSLSAAIVIATGIFGSIVGFRVLGWFRILDPTTQGLGMGTAAHAMGTYRATERCGEICGAFASIGMILNGIITAILAPSVLVCLGLL